MSYNINNGFKLKHIDLSDNTTVAHAPTTTTTALTPPPGKIYQIVGIIYQAADPVGSAAGTHELAAYYTSEGLPRGRIFLAQSATGGAVAIYIRDALLGDSSEIPSGIVQQTELLLGGVLWASNSETITFAYTNSTDVDQTGNRELYLIVKEYNEMD